MKMTWLAGVVLLFAGAYVRAEAPAALPAAPEETGSGLRGEYYDSPDLHNITLVRLDAAVNFNWGMGTPDPLLTHDQFSAIWRGYIKPKFTEKYTFWRQSDDGMRLTIDGKVVFDAVLGGQTNQGDIELTAGKKYPLLVEYQETGGAASASLLWRSASVHDEVVPTAVLYPPILASGRIAFADNLNLQKSNISILTPDHTLKKMNGTMMADPAVSPDGQKIAFTSGLHVSWTDPKIAKNTEIYLFDGKTGFTKRATDAPLEDMQPAFSPDGKQIAFTSKRDGNWEIYLMTPSVNKLKRITNNKAADQAPAFSADGKSLYFQTNRDGQWEIYVMDLDTGEETRLTDRGGASPACSPDGRWVAFVSQREGGRSQIYLMKPDGSEQQHAFTDAYENDCPTFSPESYELAFASTRDGKKSDIFVLNLVGKTIDQLTTTGSAYHPSWGR